MKQAKLDFYKEIEELKISQEFDKFISSLYTKDWIVYCKPPFKNANSVIEYLGRYTHRVAISNSRILHILPPRFMKIRHYGLLGNRNKTKKLTLCKSLTNTKVLTKENNSAVCAIKLNKLSSNCQELLVEFFFELSSFNFLFICCYDYIIKDR